MITIGESSHAGLVIQVTGAFDPDAARRLGDMLAMALPDARLTIDFSQAAAFPDSAVAMLAQDIQGAACSVTLVGLLDHQRRILSYFGVEDLKECPADEEG